MTGSGFGATTQIATGIQYRASGAAKHVSYGSGAQLNVTYNGRSLPTRYELSNVILSGTTPTIMGTENQFYADGRIQYAQDLQNGNFDRAYDYDHVGRIKEAYLRDQGLANLLLDSEFKAKLDAAQRGWRTVVSTAMQQALPVLAMSSSLGYFDMFRSANQPEQWQVCRN